MSRIVLVTLLAVAMLLNQSLAVYADDDGKDNTDTVIDIGIYGDVEVDIGASGPSELNVKAEGPAKVSIDAGNEVSLNIEASDEPQVLIKGQDINEPARQQETEYENQVNSGFLQPNDPVASSGNHMNITLAAAAIAAGLAAFFLIGRFIYRKRSEGKTK